ncbi:hydantoinase B/oxoprolinase family protein [Methylacidimicrobium sp. B4]|uniref:hydantoinase B/oxoprolinase family protein n=1 Tax=Methylacidimicrobium sp. B4 TaxID=2796139 RepID=UPI001A8D7372|nr:hydantoinase B/oxoprolinase family protein [Methylacidimicrobium sp. B4]QSR84768.1 hydantoinase B/oxoprolinase family protein [Methylacidimicrobium sp. B4]
MNPIQLEIFRALFVSVAEEMGSSLRRTAFSPNIRERCDYSCALYEASGRLAAQGDHMPVHLGSMPVAVRRAIQAVPMGPGDAVILNDPYEGGTHLPDLTLVTPVYGKEEASGAPLFYVASRAHHADIGGMTAGSMPPSSEIFQEGLRIPAVKLVEGGKWNQALLQVILANVRTPGEREGDLAAQLAANRTGEDRLRQMLARYGKEQMQRAAEALIDYTERMVRRRLAEISDGTYEAVDYLDDDGFSEEPIPIRVAIRKRGEEALIDFTGSGPQVQGNVNAVLAIALSAVSYVVRSLLEEDVPANAGLLAPIEVVAPPGSVVNALFPAAVAAGNVETSQRLVDVLLRALGQALPERIPAAGGGTMNNLTLGGIHPDSGCPFAYYETIAGGMGGGPSGDGDSGVHTHMTNSRNTPVEALEHALPVRVVRYRLRRGSGGAGKHRGGDGVIREIEFLTDMDVTLLSDRRRFPPYGLQGGASGARGENLLIDEGGETPLPGKISFRARRGQILSIRTPGGGGWGRPSPPKTA